MNLPEVLMLLGAGFMILAIVVRALEVRADRLRAEADALEDQDEVA